MYDPLNGRYSVVVPLLSSFSKESVSDLGLDFSALAAFEMAFFVRINVILRNQGTLPDIIFFAKTTEHSP